MSNEEKSEKTTTARAGEFNAGGNFVVNVRDDVKLEGTKIEPGGVAAITAGGNVELSAARHIKKAATTKLLAAWVLTAIRPAWGCLQKVKHLPAAAHPAWRKPVISSKLEGTKQDTTGNTSLQAGAKVALKAAKSTSTAVATSVSGGHGVQKGKNDSGKKETTGSVEAGGKLASSNKVESQAVAINSGLGNVTISGKQVVNQETDSKTGGATKPTG